VEHNVVPVLARANLEQNTVPDPALANPDRDTDPHDDSIKSRIAHQQIAPPTQHKEGQFSFLCEADRFGYLCLVFDFAEEARRATDPKRRVRGKRNELLKLQGGMRHGLRVQHRFRVLTRKVDETCLVEPRCEPSLRFDTADKL
jgi:hypothetical protein